MPTVKNEGLHEGHGRTWKDMEGHGRTWKDMEGHGRTWKDMEGHGRTQAAVNMGVAFNMDKHISTECTPLMQWVQKSRNGSKHRGVKLSKSASVVKSCIFHSWLPACSHGHRSGPGAPHKQAEIGTVSVEGWSENRDTTQSVRHFKAMNPNHFFIEGMVPVAAAAANAAGALKAA